MLAIKRSEIKNLLLKLAEKNEVFAPIKPTEGESFFEKFFPESELDLDYETTKNPAKRIFFPAEEKIFSFNKIENKIIACPDGGKSGSANKKEILLFGINTRDTEALIQLDEIMKRPEKDFFYFQKRSAATIISIVNENGAIPHAGVDLVLEKVDGELYKALAITEKGRKITSLGFFSKIQEARWEEKKEALAMPELRKMLKDPEKLKDVVRWSWKSMPKFWEDLGKKCLGCGICTYVCPLCHCFSTEDTCELNGKKCFKSRKWAACTLPEFATVTGSLPSQAGHDFHPSIKERYYNWFFHKFVRGYKEFGKSQCVACGRCKKYCPAGIDIEKILLELNEKYDSSRDKA
ncbi:MAG: 4Fe-4S dicluster domain-containing protein [Candidatus Pacebacteria bacterium]|nr:4Fe-4S dicluster domain-containing protein [Candidatus Paceibacterota bacterium]